MIYYLYGDDTYSKHNWQSKFIDGRQTQTFNFANVDYGMLLSEMLSIDLFAEEKVYIIENFKLFSNKSEKLSKADLAIISQVLKSDNEIIIHGERAVNHNIKIVKELTGKLEEHQFIIQALDYDSAIKQYIFDNQIKIHDDALDALKHNFSDNIIGATNDLSKIWEYTNHQVITIADVNTAGQKLIEHKIFELYNLIVTSQREKAMNYLSVLRAEGVADSDILLVSFTQIKRLYHTKVLIEKGYNDFKIAETIGANSFAIKHNRRVLRNVSTKRLEKLVQTIADYDYKFKSGSVLPAGLVDLLVIQ